jgi:hypothetical protein
MHIAFAPKYPLSQFAREGCNIFLSKKKPILIVANMASHEETERALRQYSNRVEKQDQKANLLARSDFLETQTLGGLDSHRTPS